ncbi:DUF6351 family protein [Pseudomaricurvus sp.]|uniref:DUF6351 family protein n=1 Tax=Pseudomaricurvus sp. TaxID=2004510 RepID=UPI003F6AA76E
MLRFLKWTFGVIGLLFLGVIGVSTYLYVVELPSLHEPPKTIVQHLPSGSGNYGAYPAYSGSHPGVSPRPEDSYRFPIQIGETGPLEPLFSGPNTYPFWCGRNTVTHLQPVADNFEGVGIPVFSVDEEGEPTEEVIGYSRDCLHPTAANYFFLNSKDGRFYRIDKKTPEQTIEKITISGVSRDFIVRLETGTINRFFYAIAVLKGDGESLERPLGNLWNQRLIYQFRGGVGIGKRQGNIKPNDILKRRKDQLRKGYAVVYSSANQTSNHYNMWVAEDVAARVKKQFIGLYGDPLYTVGIGGSGGAIQQYLLAQNHPGLLDGLIPLYSYPDMVSQTTYVLDCEPLEYFFDVQDRQNPRWESWGQRVMVEGLSSTESNINYFQAMSSAASVLLGNFDGIKQLSGSSECVSSWRGLTPLVNNPNFVHFAKNFSPEIQKKIRWTHWEDLYQIYGRDENGYAQSIWDNVGIQYGLKALTEQKISVEEFLTINAKVGGWKSPEQMQQEEFWFLQGDVLPVKLSVWSHQNQLLPSGPESPAARTSASLDAIEGVFRSGHVFLGQLDLPILDVRHYLDPQLDMHHSSASFMTRSRMLKSQGTAANQIIWISDPDYNPVERAFAVMDEWLLNIKMNDELSVAENRPYFAEDSCFNKEGETIARGARVWDGAWNQQPVGACMQVYPAYMTSREIAGAPISGDVFKCQTQPVSAAIKQGLYGRVDMTPYQEKLEHIFPEGVCDFTQPGLGRPDNLLTKPMLANSQDAVNPPNQQAQIEFQKPEITQKKPSEEVREVTKMPEPKEMSAHSAITLSRLEAETASSQ